MKKKARKIIMTRTELAAELGLKETYLTSHWAEIKRRYENNLNIKIFKVGRGAAAKYGILSYGDKEVRWEKR